MVVASVFDYQRNLMHMCELHDCVHVRGIWRIQVVAWNTSLVAGRQQRRQRIHWQKAAQCATRNVRHTLAPVGHLVATKIASNARAIGLPVLNGGAGLRIGLVVPVAGAIVIYVKAGKSHRSSCVQVAADTLIQCCPLRNWYLENRR